MAVRWSGQRPRPPPHLDTQRPAWRSPTSLITSGLITSLPAVEKCLQPLSIERLI